MKINKNNLLVVIAVLAIALTGVLVFANSPVAKNNKVLSFLKFTPPMSTDAIVKKSLDYLNNSVLQNGQVATLDSVTRESGVVHMKIKIGSTSYDSYATLDGNLLFPEALTMGAIKATANTQDTQPTGAVTPANVAKVDNTKLEAYVVSGCPFGIQIQRALSSAIEGAPLLANYVKVRYIGAVSGNTITAMHGNEEAQENLRQMCIRDEQPAKYWPYVACYIKKAAGAASNGMPYGDSVGCQTTAGVDKANALGQVYQNQVGGITGLSNLNGYEGDIANLMAGKGATQGQGIVGAEQARQQNYQNTTNAVLGLGGIGASMMPGGVFSDARLKDSVRFIGKLGGHNWYAWKWNKLAEKLGLTGNGEGVMAHEVERYAPHAIGESNGFMTVNYNAI